MEDKKKKNSAISVLITSSGSFGIPQLINCLKKNSEKRRIRIVCTDIEEQPIILPFSDAFYTIPKGNSKGYIESLLKICRMEKVEVILPCSSLEVFEISKNIRFFLKKGIKPAVSDYEILKKLRCKDFVYEVLKEKIPLPKYFVVKSKKEFLSSISNLGFPKNPICFKPAKYLSSDGMRGFRVLRKNNSLNTIILKNKPGPEIDLETALRFFEKTKEKFLVMDFLPGNHHSVYCFADSGKLVYCVPLHYKKFENGNGMFAVYEENEELIKACGIIHRKFNLEGNFDVEFREDKNGKLRLLEINPRIASGISFPMVCGLNLPYLAIKKLMGHKIIKKKLPENFICLKHLSQLKL